MLNQAVMVRARHSITLMVVVAVSAVMRLPGLLRDGLWRDQANLYVQISAPSFGEFLARVKEMEWHPPLYFLLNYAWIKMVGSSELAFTFLPFLFSIAAVPVIYLLGKAVGSSRIGLVAAFLYAVAPISTNYAEEYVYPMMAFVATVLVLLVIRARQACSAATWIALAVTASAAMYTHYTALLLVALLMLWVLWRPGKAQGLSIAAALAVGALPFIFWLPVLFAQHRIGVPYQLPPATLFGRIHYIASTILLFMPAWPNRAALAICTLLVAAILILIWRRKLNGDASAVGALFLSMLLLTALAGLTARRYMVPYYGLLSVFMAWIVVSVLDCVPLRDAGGRRKWEMRIGTAVACAYIVFGLRTVFEAHRVPKSGIRTLISAHSPEPQVLYVIAPDYLASTFDFYARSARFRGFVRWHHPEIFRLAGYAAAWNDPAAIERALREIASEAGRYRQLELVLDATAHDEGRIPYSKSDILLSELRKRYRVLGHANYAGRVEPVSLYRLSLTMR